jgi:hypothetical protein
MKKSRDLALYAALALSVLILVARALANDITGQVTIGDTSPSIGDITIYNELEMGGDPITLTAGSTVMVRAEAMVSDQDGWTDMPNITYATLYHYSSDSSSADDENRHYTSDDCIFEETLPNEKLVTCFFDIGFMALSGTWTVNMTISDLLGANFSGTQATTINDLTAIELTDSSVNFGVVSMGANSSVPGNMTIMNMGNILINAVLSGTNYTCSTGTIPVGNTRYSLAAGNYDSMSVALSAVPTGQYTLNLGVRGVATADGVNSTKNEYWTIKIPSSGLSGTCNNTISVTAIGGA